MLNKSFLIAFIVILHTKISKNIYISYLLEYGQKNPRWLNSSSSHPIFIITPINESDIGAIIFYFEIAKKGENLAFPGGLYPSVGSGGGIGTLMRKFEIPFPCRKGNLFNIQYMVNWYDNSENISNKKIKWLRELYEKMKPFVSHFSIIGILILGKMMMNIDI